jgi:branched-chain amino acid transport system permease protein
MRSRPCAKSDMSIMIRQRPRIMRWTVAFPGRYLVMHVVLGLVLIGAPAAINSDSALQIVNLALIYGIAALGLNIIFGLSGLLSIAQGAVMGVGGYALVFAMGGMVGVVPALLLACVSGAVVSGLTGLASARIRSHYFILLTLALAEAEILLLQNNPDLTGGSNGMPLQGTARIFGWDLTTAHGLFYCAMPMLLLSWYLADCFKRSRPGLALRTLSAHEYLAIMAGVATGRARFYATLIGGAFAGLAGGLLVVDDAYIGPQNFDIDTASLLLLIIVLGGPGSNAGTVVAATILTVLVQGTIMWTTLGQLIYGLAIIILIIVAPGGLAGLARLLLNKVARAIGGADRFRHRST